VLFASSRGGRDRHLARYAIPHETLFQVPTDADTGGWCENNPILYRVRGAVPEWPVFR
jgi:hypothetical protein